MDIMAILKRSAFILVSKTSVYWRLPGPIEKDVNRMSWLLPDLVKPSSKHIIANFRKKGPPPADQESRLLWENTWLQEAIRRHDSPDAVPPPAPLLEAVRVKRERITWARALSAQSLHAPIDLESPSPKKVKVNDLAVRNPDFLHLHENSDVEETKDGDDVIPRVGEAPDGCEEGGALSTLERDLEEIMDDMPGDQMDVASFGSES